MTKTFSFLVHLFHFFFFSRNKKAALLLSNLSSDTEEIRKNLRYTGLALPCVSLLKSKLPQLQEQGCRLIANLCMDEFNRLELSDSGAEAPLKILSTYEKIENLFYFIFIFLCFCNF